jgi:hypothetical protein
VIGMLPASARLRCWVSHPYTGETVKALLVASDDLTSDAVVAFVRPGWRVSNARQSSLSTSCPIPAPARSHACGSAGSRWRQPGRGPVGRCHQALPTKADDRRCDHAAERDASG